MKITELQRGKWYKNNQKKKIIDKDYFFFFESFKYGNFYNEIYLINNYYICGCDEIYKYYTSANKEILLSKKQIFEEINFSDIISFLPDNHPDKKIYFRNKKIKLLLNV